MASFSRQLTVIAGCLLLWSCNRTTEIPFPKTLAENLQPVPQPLELTDPKPLHWDTVSRQAIIPTVFPLDFRKLKGIPYDVNGYKTMAMSPTTSAFNLESLPSKPFDLAKIPEHQLKMEVKPLPNSFSNVKVRPPERVVASSMDLSVMQQITGSLAAGPGFIVKDSSGFLWMGSTNGLYRYDGAHLETIVPNISVAGINIDNEGIIWFIAQESGSSSAIYNVDLKRGYIGKAIFPLGSSTTAPLQKDSEGNFWVGFTKPSVVFKINPEKMLYQILDEESGMKNQRYYQIIEDGEKNIWLCSTSGVDIIMHGERKMAQLGKAGGLSDDNISALTVGKDGRIWAGWPNGVDVVDLKGKRIVHYRSSQFFGRTSKLMFDKTGQLWQSYFTHIPTCGVVIWNFEDSTNRFIGKHDGVPENSLIVDTYDDGNGKVYFSALTPTLGGSTYIVRQYGKTVYPFGNVPIYSSVEDSREHLWVGTPGNLIAVDSARKTYWHINSSMGIANDTIEAIIPQNGKVIITTDGGYNVYDANRNELLRLSRKEGLKARKVYGVMEDSEGNQWISATTDGIFKYEPKSKLTLQLTQSGGLNVDYAIQIQQLKNKKIWVLTNGTPSIIDPETNTIRSIKNIPQLSQQTEKLIYVDSHDRIWLGVATQTSHGGLFMIDNENRTFTSFSIKSGLSNDVALSILERNGRIFVGTNRMINVISPPELSASKEWEVQILKNSESLVKSANTYVSDAITKRGNYLWGDDGIHIIYGITADTGVARCFISGMDIMAQAINFKQKSDTGQQVALLKKLRWDSLSWPYSLPLNLKLPYDVNALQFHFTEMSTGRMDTTTYAYVLEGQDKEWTTTIDDHTQTYLNLAPGDYTFKVRSRWTSGRWSEPAIFSFTIRPPWYNTWWAYLIYAIAGILLLRLYLEIRSRKLKKENKILEEKVKHRTEELQQSYNNVEQLGKIGRKITSSLSVEKIIGTAYNNVNSLMDASVFGIGIYHLRSESLDFPATYENGQQLPFYSNSIHEKNKFSVNCFNSGKEIVMGDLNEEYKAFIQQLPAPHAGDQSVSLIYLPLTINEKKLGVITVQSFKKNAYTENHLNMLRNIANYTAIALENAESYSKLNHSLVNLRETQSQLIQSEKMASLGELTAGIAHEIQNPLNFVNNFSDVNSELIAEMKQEIENGNLEEVKSLAGDILANEQKINHHGKRADAIVKGMLQHSRNNSGQRELTDLNALADEYLRLSYHGLRAKDKSFNATMKMDFDESVGKVNIVPQDLGRVILNLLNNAFYAVTQRKKQQPENYEPTVSVSTMKNQDHVVLSIADNGNGIPKEIVDKIFQPFFTTKPTGQGTGLGLSLSYDIVRAHGGELKFNTIEGEGTEFTLELPLG